MDNLKKYLQSNRALLDTEEYSADETWDNIQNRLKQNGNKRFLYRWVAAVSLFILVISGYYFVIQHEQPSKPVTVRSQQQGANKEVKFLTDTLMIKSTDMIVSTESNGEKDHQKTAPRGKSFAKAKKQRKAIPEIEQLEIGFQNIINAQLKSIRSTPFYAENPDYFSYFKKEYIVLEKDESSLKTEIKQYGMNDTYLDRLIAIYQGKLFLLKKLRIEIQQMNNRIQQSNPDVINHKPYFINI